MFRLFTICALFAFASYCNGDDTPRSYANPTDSDAANETHTEPPFDEQQPPKLDEATRKYISEHVHKLIDKYEARIEQLENELARRPKPQPAPRYATPTPVQPPPSPYAPSQPTPAPAQLPSPYAQPSLSTVPDTWQRFNFNGQWFYIIPVEQAAMFAPSFPR